MSKTLRDVYEIDAPVGDVFAALSGDGWAPAKAAALHDDSQTVRREVAADGGVVLEVSRKLPDGVPGFLQKFLPADGRARQTDSWGPLVGGAHSGTWKADLPGAPTRIGGTMRLEPTAAGTRYTIDGDVTVKIPLVGGKAEGFIAGMISTLTAAELDVLRAMVRPT